MPPSPVRTQTLLVVFRISLFSTDADSDFHLLFGQPLESEFCNPINLFLRNDACNIRLDIDVFFREKFDRERIVASRSAAAPRLRFE